MIKKIKKVFIPIFLAVICGSICGKLVSDIYANSLTTRIDTPKIYLIQAGAYSSYDNMVSNTNVGNYIYYEDDGLFKAIIGITENYNNISKIQKTYNGESIVSEYYSDNIELNKKIKEYDKKINDTNDTNEIKKTVLEMIDLYKDNENNTLIKIS